MAEKFPPPLPSNSFSYLPLLKRTPLISIVMPTYNSLWLREAINSVLAQSYKNFELVLVDDCSTDPRSLQVIEQMAKSERVHTIRNPRNLGITAATNVGIEASQGEYIAFMDSDDLIHPDALAYFVRVLNDNHDPDVFFSNEVVINDRDIILGYMKKCPVSMDLLLSCNVVMHLSIIRRSVLLKIGLLRPEYNGSQDHELMIRAMESGLKFFHLPCYLYAWRTHRSSWSSEVRFHHQARKNNYPQTYLNGKKAVQDYLDRNGIRATVTDDAFYWYRVKYELPASQKEVAIIIPFRDHPDCLCRLLTSMEKTSYKNFVLYLVNNQSALPETLALLLELEKSSRFKTKIINFNEPFNYSRLYNTAVAQINHELMLFMNNDLEVIRGDWLETMLEHIYRDKVGAVGCRLIRKNGELQHAGMTFQPNIHFCARNLNREEGYYTKVQREVAAVTCACMLTRKSVFQKAGGFDEVHFPIGFSDDDLCLKITRLGYKIIYTPFAELYHHESFSRKTHQEGYEKFALFNRYIGTTPLVDSHYWQG